jgi:hypothetical protein
MLIGEPSVREYKTDYYHILHLNNGRYQRQCLGFRLLRKSTTTSSWTIYIALVAGRTAQNKASLKDSNSAEEAQRNIFTINILVTMAQIARRPAGEQTPSLERLVEFRLIHGK